MVGSRHLAMLGATLVVAVTVVGCATRETPAPAGIRPDGFPTGVFTQTFDDPDVGPIRISWVFEADGDWAEVPETTMGQTWPGGPARGHYTVDGDLLSITVEAPPFWGDHSHRWRFDGQRLMTTYEDSELPDDGWLEMLGRQPWVRAT
ncbi:MAG TPA: hypothetical protein VK867_12960 [Candidatus Limnocylindrales bacterium]|nr:hypothetical protein [Candidatus Limnocylindrales bacterium]